MIPSTLNPADEVTVGNDAGWLLSFCDEQGEVILELGRNQYHAELDATLPSGLQGGQYKFIIEGITDEHYATIARTSENEDRAAFVDLYLYWRDTASSVIGYMKNLAGLTDLMGGLESDQLGDFLVARLAVSSVKRKKGDRRYVAEVSARERVHSLAGQRRVCGEIGDDQPVQLAESLAEAAAIEVEPHAIEAASTSSSSPDTGLCTPERGRTTTDALNYLGKKMEERSNQHGRGMLLIRDGVLHIGARPIPLSGEPKPLHTGNGLLEIEALKSVTTDPYFDICAQPAPAGGGVPSAPKRKQFKLTLKGRADLKPGDVVQFLPPAPDLSRTGGQWMGSLGETAMAAVGGELLPSLGLGDLGNDAVSLYVHSINHKQGRTCGFVTQLTGIEISLPDDGWDQHSPANGQLADTDDEPESASSAGRVARAQRKLIGRVLSGKSFTEIAEVRTANLSGGEEPPAQTETLWRGLVGGDGSRHQSRRLDIQRPSDAPIEGTPYLTPFAWGRCGLVLPRYPGTRVAVTHRQTSREEPIDIGAMWKSGQAPDSQAGDWWLSLPSEVPGNVRSSISGEEPVDRYDGKVTNDLIDADGNRVVEVGSFTLRFHSEGLNKAGERPQAAAESDAVTIEHAKGKSKIVMKSDGIAFSGRHHRTRQRQIENRDEERRQHRNRRHEHNHGCRQRRDHPQRQHGEGGIDGKGTDNRQFGRLRPRRHGDPGEHRQIAGQRQQGAAPKRSHKLGLRRQVLANEDRQRGGPMHRDC